MSFFELLTYLDNGLPFCLTIAFAVEMGETMTGHLWYVCVAAHIKNGSLFAVIELAGQRILDAESFAV